MPETKVISTGSLVTNDGSTIQAYTYYNDGLPNLIDLLLSITNGSRNNVLFKEGELIVLMKNYPQDFDVQVSNRGELVIFGEDADHYSINADGELIYTL